MKTPKDDLVDNRGIDIDIQAARLIGQAKEQNRDPFGRMLVLARTAAVRDYERQRLLDFVRRLVSGEAVSTEELAEFMTPVELKDIPAGSVILMQVSDTTNT